MEIEPSDLSTLTASSEAGDSSASEEGGWATAESTGRRSSEPLDGSWRALPFAEDGSESDDGPDEAAEPLAAAPQALRRHTWACGGGWGGVEPPPGGKIFEPPPGGKNEILGGGGQKFFEAFYLVKNLKYF